MHFVPAQSSTTTSAQSYNFMQNIIRNKTTLMAEEIDYQKVHIKQNQKRP